MAPAALWLFGERGAAFVTVVPLPQDTALTIKERKARLLRLFPEADLLD